MLPISGSSARIPQYTHGSSSAFIFAWIIWLTYLACMAAEIQAVLQYTNFYIQDLTNPDGSLTVRGYSAAIIIALFVCVVNTYSLRWLIRANTALTLLKLAIPIFIVSVILIHFFSPDRVLGVHHGGFLPLGWHGVLSAISAGGIVFAFNGFKQAAEMAGEAKNPHITVPLAIIGSILICLILFLLLQVALLTSLNDSNLLQGWQNLYLKGHNSPFASIVSQDKLDWLNPILYVGAIVAPLAAGLMYCASAARTMYGISKNGFMPKIFQYLTPHGNPIAAITLNFFLCLSVFAPLPGWNSIAGFLTSLFAMTYIIGPVCFVALRQQLPYQYRPLKLPLGYAWALIAFYICTLLAYWSGWMINLKMTIILIVGYGLFLGYHWTRGKKSTFKLDFMSSLWLWTFLLGLDFFSYMGNFGGGKNILSWPEEMIGLFIFSIFNLWLARAFCLPAEETQKHIDELNLSHHH